MLEKNDNTENRIIAAAESNTAFKRDAGVLNAPGGRYRQLFYSAPIALIKRAASRLKTHLEKLRASGVSDFEGYLKRNPDEVGHCWSMIKTVDYNPAFLELMGFNENTEPKDSFFPPHSKEFITLAKEIILMLAEGGNANEREMSLVTATGEPKYIMGKALVAPGYEHSLQRVVVALMDITQRRRAEEALRENERRFKNQSLRDDLTGLFNRRHLFQSLSQLIERARTNGDQVSLIFLDLDHFKRVVDTYGHLNGSRAIKEVAHTIGFCLEEPAYAVAYAGDEFIVVLPGMSQAQALNKASEIRSRIKETIYVLDQGTTVLLRASFGVATFPHHATDANGLIAVADQALFAVKAAGKDAVGQFQAQPRNSSYEYGAVETK